MELTLAEDEEKRYKESKQIDPRRWNEELMLFQKLKKSEIQEFVQLHCKMLHARAEFLAQTMSLGDLMETDNGLPLQAPMEELQPLNSFMHSNPLHIQTLNEVLTHAPEYTRHIETMFPFRDVDAKRRCVTDDTMDAVAYVADEVKEN